jgi:prolyl-tRNA synthetase
MGPAAIRNREYIMIRRDNAERITGLLSSISVDIPVLLDKIQHEMFSRAKKIYDQRVVKVVKWNEVVPRLEAKNMLLVPWCNETGCGEAIRKRTNGSNHNGGAQCLCIPLEQPSEGVSGMGCIQCSFDAKVWALFARCY